MKIIHQEIGHNDLFTNNHVEINNRSNLMKILRIKDHYLVAYFGP